MPSLKRMALTPNPLTWNFWDLPEWSEWTTMPGSRVIMDGDIVPASDRAMPTATMTSWRLPEEMGFHMKSVSRWKWIICLARGTVISYWVREDSSELGLMKVAERHSLDIRCSQTLRIDTRSLQDSLSQLVSSQTCLMCSGRILRWDIRSNISIWTDK